VNDSYLSENYCLARSQKVAEILNLNSEIF
jgi:hypothetical protein